MPSPVPSNCDAHDTIANRQYGAVWSMGLTQQVCVRIVLLPSNVWQQFFGRSAFLRQQETDLPPAELWCACSFLLIGRYICLLQASKPQASGTSGISYVAISVPPPSPLQNKHFLFLKYLLYSSSFGRTQHFKTPPPLTKKRSLLVIVPRRARDREVVEDDERSGRSVVAAVAEWSRYRIVVGLVTNLNPAPLRTRRVGQRTLDRFSVHRCPTRRVFSGTGLELVTKPATIRCLYHSATAATSRSVTSRASVKTLKKINEIVRFSVRLKYRSCPVPLKTRRVGQQCTLNLSS
ncbi:hypothetical protein TNCV_3662711 [Trichonephila clavipes]|nr:hypothetical protein TNCV_3662711 [Trichonephila clavipes]